MATEGSEYSITERGSILSEEKEEKEKTVCARLVLTKEQVINFNFNKV